MTDASGTSAGAAAPSTRTSPHSTCRGSTVGWTYALAIAIASSRTRSRIIVRVRVPLAAEPVVDDLVEVVGGDITAPTAVTSSAGSR